MIKINFDQLLLIRKQFEIHFQQAKTTHRWKNHPFIYRDIDKLVAEITPEEAEKTKKITELYCLYHILNVAPSIAASDLSRLFASVKEDLTYYENKLALNFSKLFFDKDIFNISIQQAYFGDKKPIDYLIWLFSFLDMLEDYHPNLGLTQSLSILNKIQDETFMHHQFKDKLLLSLDKAISPLQFIEYLSKKLNEQANSATDFRVLQSKPLREGENLDFAKIDLTMTALWSQQEEEKLQIRDQASSEPISIHDYIRYSLQHIETTLVNPIQITNKKYFPLKQMHHVAVISREQLDKNKALYLEGLFEYEKTSKKEKRNIGLKIVCKSTDIPGVYQTESISSATGFSSETQRPFFFDESQFVSLYDKTIIAKNLDQETFLRIQHNPFLENQRAQVGKTSQQHYLVIRIHLVPDENGFAELLERMTRQCATLKNQRIQKWSSGPFFEPLNPEKKVDQAFYSQNLAEDDDGLNQASTSLQQDWKVKNVCVDRVALQVAPEMTLQAMLAGQEQDVIQLLANKATAIFTEKSLTRSFSESPLLVFEQETGHGSGHLPSSLALKPNQVPSSATQDRSTQYSQAVQTVQLTPEKIDQNSCPKHEMKEEVIRQGARLRRCGLS